MIEKNPQMRPASPAQAPDTARSYERAQPEKEGGMGRLDNNKATPERSDECAEQAVTHRQPNRQLNSEDVVDQRAGRPAQGEALAQSDHSMKEDEPKLEDQAPTDIRDPHRARHPRTEGKGGTP